MKNNFLLMIAVVAICSSGIAQAKTSSSKDKKPEDQIRQYFFVMLSKGNNRTTDTALANKLQAGHMANIYKLYYEGKLKVSGPFGDDGNWRGIFIFDCATKEEVEQLLKSDPAIAAGSLTYEIHPWYTASMGSFAPGKPKKE